MQTYPQYRINEETVDVILKCKLHVSSFLDSLAPYLPNVIKVKWKLGVIRPSFIPCLYFRQSDYPSSFRFVFTSPLFLEGSKTLQSGNTIPTCFQPPLPLFRSTKNAPKRAQVCRQWHNSWKINKRSCNANVRVWVPDWHINWRQECGGARCKQFID